MKKLISIKILRSPVFTTFKNDWPFTAVGLLCEGLYDDGSREYITQPYIPTPKGKNTDLEVRIYKDKETLDVYASYIIHVEGETKLEKPIICKKGTFKSTRDIIEYEKGNTIRCNKKDEYNEKIINKVLEYAKINNINIIWEDIK